MARPRAGGGVTLEADFSRGIVRDEPRSSIPQSGLYDSFDFLLDRPGLARKRGGTVYAGPALAGSSYVYSVFYADFPTGAKVIAIDERGHLYEVGATSTTERAAMTTSFLAREKLKLRVDTVVLCANDGITAPKKAYVSGGTLTVMDLGGLPPAGQYSEVYATRSVIANTSAYPNRVFFSSTPNIESPNWDTTNAWIDADYKVTGLASLNSGLLVFSEGHYEILTGSSPPPGGDMSRRTVSAIGCPDARSISKWGSNIIFANTRGVYVTNGTGDESLTEKQDGSGIASYWQQLFEAYDKTTWVVAGEVFHDYYFVSVLDNLGNSVVNLMCYLPRRAWWRVTNWQPSMFSSSVGIQEELYWADRSTNRVQAAAGIFVPDGTNKEDADGTAVEPGLEYRMIGDGAGLKAYGFGRLTYDMRDYAMDNPTLAVSVAPGLEATTYAAVSESPLDETTDADRKRFTIAKDTNALNVKLAQSGASSKTEVYALESEVRPYPLSHDGVA